jgi:hypothetical protein
MRHPEFELQKAVCKYLSFKFPNVLFLSDTVANLGLTDPQRQRNKSIQKDGFSCPDLIILEPNEKYKGLFIELKKETPFKKNGELKSQMVYPKNRPAYNHLERQQESIIKLKGLGYYACFSWGYENTIKLIEKYLNNNL